MHSIKERPVVVNGQIVIRPIMVVALTYDHRLLDGREAVTFLGKFSRSCRSQSIWDLNYFLLAVKVRDYLEDPRKMLLV
jgi:2-oxoglutarate dehydrogenase E2 component (dihydrolipoamide succinyltransferase)